MPNDPSPLNRMLIDPNDLDLRDVDPETAEILRKTVAFFETKGKTQLKRDDHERVWYADFLAFIAENSIFAKLLTPAAYGDGTTRWDTWRNCAFNEILGFYGLHYWYTWQVTILGLGPIWMGDNEAIKLRTAAMLRDGGILGFGLSEKDHGADVYSTEMTLAPAETGGWRANGRKYYIGNANRAALVSTLGKFAATDGPGGGDEFVFFAVDSQHGQFECVRNLVNVQSYVAEYSLVDYPVPDDAVLSRGQAAWDSALNTVNVGKFNLGWASIGICTHAFYEAVHHAGHRHLYGTTVTEFPHVRRFLTDAYARLIGMKLFARRAADYFRAANREDRRYLLYNPLVKMKVTSEGERVIDLLWEVIAAMGFESDTYFEMATRDIRALPKLEGTVHVNMALVVKFLANWMFRPADLAEVPPMRAAADDTFLFDQGPARGLGKIRFHDAARAYACADEDGRRLANVAVLRDQIDGLRTLLMQAPPSDSQQRDFDLLFSLGDLFTIAVYGQLILESAEAEGVDDDLLDTIFGVLVRDFSRAALDLHDKQATTEAQMALCRALQRKPVWDAERLETVYRTQVLAQRDRYEMKP